MAMLCVVSMDKASAQEFKCEVRVIASKISNVDNSVFVSMKDAIYDFMNNRKWTEINFKEEERIECSVSLLVNEVVEEGVYTCDLTIAFNRPVYSSSYQTTMLSYNDKNVRVEYTPSTTLDFAENSYMSNLTSVLGFYAYMCLGLDFDSFSLNGGDRFFRSAESVVNSVSSSSGDDGWNSMGETKTRYWMVENMTNSRYSKLHDFYYKYHRQGLDVMYKDVKTGRAAIMSALEDLQEVYRERPNLFMLQLVIESKRFEIKNIFSQADKNERTKAMNIMRNIDPSKASEYDEIIAGKK